MRPLLVVVRRVLGEDRSELPLVEDQQPVQALAANRADPPLGVGVRPRSSWWAAQYLEIPAPAKTAPKLSELPPRVQSRYRISQPGISF
jgi:hypothetical protein